MRAILSAPTRTMSDTELIVTAEIIGQMLGEIEKHPYTHGMDDQKVRERAASLRATAWSRDLGSLDSDGDGRFDRAYDEGWYRGFSEASCADGICTVCSFWGDTA